MQRGIVGKADGQEFQEGWIVISAQRILADEILDVAGPAGIPGEMAMEKIR